MKILRIAFVGILFVAITPSAKAALIGVNSPVC